jgi:integrase
MSCADREGDSTSRVCQPAELTADDRSRQRRDRSASSPVVQSGGTIRRLDIPRERFNIGPAITQQRRLMLLRKYLTDDQEPIAARVAACLLLLYALPVSRILRLTRDDLLDVDDELLLRLGDPPTPVPDPLASLLRQLADASPPQHGWVFPGRNSGQPITHRTLFFKLRRLGFAVGEARVSALRQLVLQAPAPVIAAALGVHHTTTTRQAVNAGTTWSRYAPGGRRA